MLSVREIVHSTDREIQGSPRIQPDGLAGIAGNLWIRDKSSHNDYFRDSHLYAADIGNCELSDFHTLIWRLTSAEDKQKT